MLLWFEDDIDELEVVVALEDFFAATDDADVARRDGVLWN